MIAENGVNIIKISGQDVHQAIEDWLNKSALPNAMVEVVGITYHKPGSVHPISVYVESK